MMSIFHPLESLLKAECWTSWSRRERTKLKPSTKKVWTLRNQFYLTFQSRNFTNPSRTSDKLWNPIKFCQFLRWTHPRCKCSSQTISCKYLLIHRTLSSRTKWLPQLSRIRDFNSIHFQVQYLDLSKTRTLKSSLREPRISRTLSGHHYTSQPMVRSAGLPSSCLRLRSSSCSSPRNKGSSTQQFWLTTPESRRTRCNLPLTVNHNSINYHRFGRFCKFSSHSKDWWWQRWCPSSRSPIRCLGSKSCWCANPCSSLRSPDRYPLCLKTNRRWRYSSRHPLTKCSRVLSKVWTSKTLRIRKTPKSERHSFLKVQIMWTRWFD